MLFVLVQGFLEFYRNYFFYREKKILLKLSHAKLKQGKKIKRLS